jgi:hypothetical protein
VGITAGSREVPGRKPVTRDNNNNNNNNKHYNMLLPIGHLIVVNGISEGGR